MLDYSTTHKRKLRAEVREKAHEINAIRQAHIEQQRIVPKPAPFPVTGTAKTQGVFSEPKTTRYTVGEKDKDKSIVLPKIPENWRELAWPNLRDLAQTLAGAHPIGSRNEARAIIAAHENQG